MDLDGTTNPPSNDANSATNNTPSELDPNPIVALPAFKVGLNKLFTKSSPVIPGNPFPVVSLRDQLKVKAWMERDTEYEQALKVDQIRQGERVKAASLEMRDKQDWLGPIGNPPRWKFIQEYDRLQARSKGKRGHHRPEIRL